MCKNYSAAILPNLVILYCSYLIRHKKGFNIIKNITVDESVVLKSSLILGLNSNHNSDLKICFLILLIVIISITILKHRFNSKKISDSSGPSGSIIIICTITIWCDLPWTNWSYLLIIKNRSHLFYVMHSLCLITPCTQTFTAHTSITFH